MVRFRNTGICRHGKKGRVASSGFEFVVYCSIVFELHLSTLIRRKCFSNVRNLNMMSSQRSVSR